MEIKTKYQYTYFIYPFVIDENKYDKYIVHLLHNKNFKLKKFEKEKDLGMYTYFLPKVRKYLFWQFDLDKNKMSRFNELDNTLKSTLLSKNPCTIFEYKIEKDIQGKAGNKNGIFFNIRNIEIVCFNTGICFLKIKTTLDESSTLADLCNFNYKFRNIYSTEEEFNTLAKINIQADIFQDTKEIREFIRSIIGNNIGARELNLDTERFITYSYACIGQEDWNNEANIELIEKKFYKFANVFPSNYIPSEDNLTEFYKINKNNYAQYGFTNLGTVLLTSDINTDNYTKLPHKYENEYLYNYIYNLYKKIYLKKISNEFQCSNKFNDVKQKFIRFIQGIWIEDTTNDEIGSKLSKQWDLVLNMKKTFIEAKQKYDILYKNSNIEKTAKSNRYIAIILAILVVVNIANCFKIFG